MRIFTLMTLAAIATAGPALAQEPLTDEEIRSIVRSVLAEEEAEPESAGSWKVGTKNRLTLTSPDGRFEYRLGGRIHLHSTTWSADDEFAAAGAPLEDSVFFRRARLYASGLLYGNTYFKTEYEFAGGTTSPADVYLELRELPVTKVRVGHFYEPFGLDALISDNDNTFVERNSGESAIVPSRTIGGMLCESFAGDRGTWAVGAFRETDATGSVDEDGHFAYTGRVTALPLASENGRRLVHVGAAASLRDPDNGQVGYAAEPEARKASDLIDTGTLLVDSVQLLGGELAGVLGPLSAQSEVMIARNGIEGGGSDADFTAWYAQLSWCITGEVREYRRADGCFGAVTPKRIFGEEGGWGAFETALRWSSVDLEDSGINGGTMDQLTVGANWYLNPNVRVMANVVLVDVDSIVGSGLDGNAEAFTMRFQVAF
jgi:phosphate-selective porin OprO/OprP